MRAATKTTKSAVSSTTPEETDPRMIRLGQQIRAARGEMSQAELGKIMDVPQTTISRWEMGQVDLTLGQVAKLENALRLQAGTLAIAAEYAVAEFSVRDIETMLMADPRLHQDYRRDVVRAYRSYVEMSRRLIEADEVLAAQTAEQAKANTPSRRKRSG